MEFRTWNTGLDGYTLSITVYPRHTFEVIIGKRCFLWLIKREQTESKSVARRVKIQKGESAKGSVEPAQLEALIKGEK